MTDLQRDEEHGPAQLDLLPRTACVPRALRGESARPASAEPEPTEPLDRPLREAALHVLCVLRGLEARDKVTTTRVLRHALCCPETETATRKLERILVRLQAQRLVAVSELRRKGPGRPARVWATTQAGRAELLVEYRQTAIARQQIERRERRARSRA